MKNSSLDKNFSARRETWLNRPSEDQYAQPVDHLDELPAPLRQSFQDVLLSGEVVRSVIFAPFQGFLKRPGRKRFLQRDVPLPWEFSSDRALALTDCRVLLASVSETGQPMPCRAIPFKNILSMQLGVILLFSWFELHWVDQGSVQKDTVFFNTVCEPLFRELCASIRSDIGQISGPVPSNVGSNSEALRHLPYKFRNLISLRLLLPGEQPCQAVLRDAAYARRFYFFRKLIAPRVVVVRTNLHILLIEEELAGAAQYSFITTFLPLQQVRQRVEHAPDGILLKIEANQAGKWKAWRVHFPLDQEQEVSLLALGY